MGNMYAWATPSYLLDYMTLEEVFFYYQKGLDFERQRARLIIAELNEALKPSKKRKQQSPRESQRPDKHMFYKQHSDKIKRPDKGGE